MDKGLLTTCAVGVVAWWAAFAAFFKAEGKKERVRHEESAIKLTREEARELLRERVVFSYRGEECELLRLVRRELVAPVVKVSGAPWVVVGRQFSGDRRYLVAAVADWEALVAELAEDEGGRNDDGTGGDMGVCLGGGKVDDFLAGGPGADGDNHVFVDGVGVPFDIFDGDELCVHRSEMITDGGRKGD